MCPPGQRCKRWRGREVRSASIALVPAGRSREPSSRPAAQPLGARKATSTHKKSRSLEIYTLFYGKSDKSADFQQRWNLRHPFAELSNPQNLTYHQTRFKTWSNQWIISRKKKPKSNRT